jgi:hypothetical protein
MRPPDELVSLEAAAQLLGVTRQTIANRVRERDLDERKFSGDRHIYVVLSEVANIPTRRTA